MKLAAKSLFLVCAELLCACTFVGRAQTPANLPSPGRIPPPPPGRYCVMGHSWTLEEQTMRVGNQNVPVPAKNDLIDQAEQAVADAGATCARVEVQASFIWGGVQGSLDGTRANFSRYDYIATHLAQHGIAMFPVILQYGGARIQQTSGHNHAFTSASDYGTYAQTVTHWIAQHNAEMAAAHLPQITRVELMNEPNQRYWFTEPDDPQTIADFLKAGYAAVKSVDPHLFVFAPGLANGGSSHANMYEVLQGLYAAGCKVGVCWDGISVHNFAWRLDPADYGGPAQENQWQNYRGAEAIAAANGEPNVKICLTETGFASGDGSWGEDSQSAARQMSTAYALALRDPHIACIVNASIWNGDDGGGPFGNIGLGRFVDGAFVPTARYKAFKAWARP